MYFPAAVIKGASASCSSLYGTGRVHEFASLANRNPRPGMGLGQRAFGRSSNVASFRRGYYSIGGSGNHFLWASVAKSLQSTVVCGPESIRTRPIRSNSGVSNP